MTNNIAVTEGSGTTMATDDVSSVHYPVIKLADGTEDASTRIAAGGGVEAGALRVTIASDSTGVLSIDDNGAAITVDGTVTAELSATDNAVLDSLDTKLSAIQTAVQIIDNSISGNQTRVDVIASLPAGTNNIGDVDVLSVVPGTGATALGKAEDAVHASGDTGVMMLAVRNDAGTALAADGDYIPVMVDSAGRLYVNVAAGTLALSGEDHIGEVGGNTEPVQVTPTISTSIYAALDIVGGTQTITDAMRVSGGSGVLQTITIADDANQKTPFDILIFDSAPSGGTYADQGALAHAAGDIDKLLGVVSVTAADYKTVVATSLAVATVTAALPVKASGSANLYAIPIISSGTPTYAATSDLDFIYGFLRD